MTDMKDTHQADRPVAASDRSGRCKPCGGTGAADVFAIDPCDACQGTGRPIAAGP